jgi:hypothetical protein
MSVQGRIEELSQRHRKLDETIQAEQKRPAADPATLKDLKKKKLRIKEELKQLKQP